MSTILNQNSLLYIMSCIDENMGFREKHGISAMYVLLFQILKLVRLMREKQRTLITYFSSEIHQGDNPEPFSSFHVEKEVFDYLNSLYFDLSRILFRPEKCTDTHVFRTILNSDPELVKDENSQKYLMDFKIFLMESFEFGYVDAIRLKEFYKENF